MTGKILTQAERISKLEVKVESQCISINKLTEAIDENSKLVKKMEHSYGLINSIFMWIGRITVGLIVGGTLMIAKHWYEK